MQIRKTLFIFKNHDRLKLNFLSAWKQGKKTCGFSWDEELLTKLHECLIGKHVNGGSLRFRPPQKRGPRESIQTMQTRINFRRMRKKSREESSTLALKG